MMSYTLVTPLSSLEVSRESVTADASVPSLVSLLGAMLYDALPSVSVTMAVLSAFPLMSGISLLSASFGLGLPIINNYNNRSLLNISAQWVRSSATGLIKENIFRINVGLTFNERWFAKWKVD